MCLMGKRNEYMTNSKLAKPSASSLGERSHIDYEGRRRLALCGHEIGHASIVYWRREALHGYNIVVSTDDTGTLFRGGSSLNVTELMVKIAGPLVEYLTYGITPKKAIRFRREYTDPGSDSSMIRGMVRVFCNGVDSRKFQFVVQEQTRSIIQQPAMWLAIEEATEKLNQASSITGEEMEEIFERHCAPTMFDSQPMVEWVCKMSEEQVIALANWNTSYKQMLAT
jgi:hypothetical protein